MPSALARWIRLPSIALAIGVAPRVLAAESTPARVQVDAPADCLTSSSFWEALQRRTDRVRPAEAGEGGATLDVIVRRVPGGASGEVRIARGDAVSESRSFRGASCADVTDALGLVAALAFDPTASAARKLTPPPAPPPSPAPPAPKESEPKPAAEAKPAPEPAPAPAPTPVPPTETPARDEPRAAPARANPDAPPLRLAIGGGASAMALAAPSTLLAYQGFVEAGIARVSGRLGVGYAAGTVEQGAVAADVTWLFARASICPYRFDVGGGVAVRPCVGMDAGRIGVRGTSGFASTNDQARAWLAPTGGVRLAWAPSRLFFLEAQAGAAFPVVRDAFVADPGSSLYQVPLVVPAVDLAAGVFFL